MKNKLNIIPLFSHIAHPCQFDLTEQQTKTLVEIADSVEYRKSGTYQSELLVHRNDADLIRAANLNGVQSKNLHILELPELDFINTKIVNQFTIFKDSVMRWENTDFKITTSWFTRTAPGRGGVYHTHNNTMYSGTFYFNNVEGTASCTFSMFNLNTSYLIFPTEFNNWNCTTWKFVPKNNECIFFPSHLPHIVDINTSDKVRYSLAFNIIPVGDIGWDDSYGENEVTNV